ncbi:MAG TPA: hypothetical protein PLK21_04605 [Candidatus Syntrophosphaera sp.]|mgnify:CR=1 FL=1|jgi:hypothetical protein|nr:MAG: hypothetical protein BWX83_00485 [Candidatus Cloacimonetes bacterium ADurb.Bin117]HNU54639.1 hypothetical protein [Candidatus Syntrophosphaera sp.]HOH48644.1 hypothetical protein [Candidatus Syntrophosphaera sp.]HPK82836.1 hypothetical protein [Candidatus Syntrophosphaera sp.]HPX67434.1 hypothetical protein [Candidatus Syntrophosphaera sp.]
MKTRLLLVVCLLLTAGLLSAYDLYGAFQIKTSPKGADVNLSEIDLYLCSTPSPVYPVFMDEYMELREGIPGRVIRVIISKEGYIPIEKDLFVPFLYSSQRMALDYPTVFNFRLKRDRGGSYINICNYYAYNYYRPRPVYYYYYPGYYWYPPPPGGYLPHPPGWTPPSPPPGGGHGGHPGYPGSHGGGGVNPPGGGGHPGSHGGSGGHPGSHGGGGGGNDSGITPPGGGHGGSHGSDPGSGGYTPPSGGFGSGGNYPTPGSVSTEKSRPGGNTGGGIKVEKQKPIYIPSVGNNDKTEKVKPNSTPSNGKSGSVEKAKPNEKEKPEKEEKQEQPLDIFRKLTGRIRK